MMVTGGWTQHAVLLLAAWCSGISVYLTVLALGVSQRMGWIELPGELGILGHPLVIVVAVLMYFIEFFADKVPWVDSAWDSVHTFIRPAGAMALAYYGGTDYEPAVQMAYLVLSGAVAFETHAVKSSTRLLINTSPEPFSNIAASLAEDLALIGMVWFFIQHPILAVILLVCLIVGFVFVLMALWKFVTGFFKKKPGPATPK